MRYLKSFIDEFLKVIITIHKMFTIEDPCESCLVKPLCNEKCKERIMLDKFLFPYDSLKECKTMTLVFGIPTLISACVLVVGIFVFLSGIVKVIFS
jgi:sulfatase maturation enzyme AslB (radical SAM superfamily)